MNIPNRRSGDYGAVESSNSLWSMMGNQEKMHMSTSLGSHNMCSDSSSSSDDDDLMDEDMDEAYVTTPQVAKTANAQWPSGSPAANSLLSFQQRQRPRKQPRRKVRGPLGLGFGSISAAIPSLMSKSPPSAKSHDLAGTHSRRESISWAANQLHISGSEGDEAARAQDSIDSITTPSRPGVIKRAVTRRGNLLVGSLLPSCRALIC